MRQFSHRTRIKAPIAAVAAFHLDSRALKLLTPPPVFVQMQHVDPLAENSIADFTLWIGPLPVRWVAVHTEVDPRSGFKDRQVHGPFKFWVHRHTFEQQGADVTDVIDEIQAEFGHGFWGLLSRFMWINLPFMFAYRGWVTRRAVAKTVALNEMTIR